MLRLAAAARAHAACVRLAAGARLACAAAAASGAAAATAAATSPLSAPLAAPEAARAATGGSGDAPRVREFRVRRRNQQHSPKKLNLIAKLIRGKSLRDALVQCQLSSKKAAKIMLKALDNAAFIAHRNYSMDPSRLRIKVGSAGRAARVSGARTCCLKI